MSDFSAGFLTGWGCALLAIVAAFVVELFRNKHRDHREQMSDAWKREAWRHHDLER